MINLIQILDLVHESRMQYESLAAVWEIPPK